MDMQYEYIEIKADRVAEDIVKYCVWNNEIATQLH
jgi:hypothetical protein